MAVPEPGPLRPATHAPRNWFAEHAVGLATFVVGAVAFVVVSLSQDALWSQPDLRLTLPFFAATAVGAVVSFVRKEGSAVLPLAGVGLAAVAMVLGWFLVTALVVAGTAVLMLIMHSVM